MKSIFLIIIAIVNIIFLLVFLFFKGFNPIDLYLSHFILIAFVCFLVYGYELKYGSFKYLKDINNLIDMPISKFIASQIDLKMIYSSKLLSIIVNVNFIIILIHYFINRDIDLINIIELSAFYYLLIISLINLTSFLKVFWGFQSFIYVLFSFILFIQILGNSFFSDKIIFATNPNYLVLIFILNMILIVFKKILFKNWL